MSARPASTLLLLRSGEAPVEVLMIKRAAELFGGGWWVFPGGTITAVGDSPPPVAAGPALEAEE